MSLNLLGASFDLNINSTLLRADNVKYGPMKPTGWDNCIVDHRIKISGCHRPQRNSKWTKTRAKHVLPNINRTQSPKSPPAATQWSRTLLHDVICSERVTVRHATERTIPSLPGVMGVHSSFFVPGDPDH